MTVTTAEIRNKALRKLGLLRMGESARPEYAEDLDAAYGEVYAELEAEELPVWSSTAAVPKEYAAAMVALCAYHRLTDYNVPERRAQAIILDAGPEGESAKNRIRKLKAGLYVPTTTRFLDY